MARNGANIYSKPAGTTAVFSTNISSAKYNELMDDFAADLNLVRPVVAGGTGGSTPNAARVSLGVQIGSDVQGYDAGLASISALTLEAGKGIYATGANTYATYDLGELSRTFLANTTIAGQRSALELGTAALGTVGLEEGNLIALDVDGKLPAIDGSQLTGIEEPVKCWAAWNGVGSATISQSLGVDTVSRTSLGRYLVTLDVARPDADFGVLATAGDSLGTRLAAQYSVLSASEIEVYVINHGNGQNGDAEFVTFMLLD